MITNFRAETPARVRTLVRWLRFNLVGGIGIVVQFVALFLLKSILHLDYLTATALAVETAVLHNFLWHERFTWVDRVQGKVIDSIRRLLRFNLTTGAVSILGNLLLMRLLVGGSHLKPMLANLMSIAVCSLVNFLVSDRWVFRTVRAH